MYSKTIVFSHSDNTIVYMSYTSDDVEEVKDMLIDIGDEFAWETQEILPEDMYFFCLLLNEYYGAQSKNESGSETVCDISWSLAREFNGIVQDNEKVDWLNAYFICDGLFNCVSHRLREYPSRDRTAPETVQHYSEFSFNAENLEHQDTSFDGMDELFDEIRELLELYVDLDEDTDAKIPKARALQMFFSILSKRYAHDFTDADMIESIHGINLTQAYADMERDEETTDVELYEAVRLTRDWLELRMKREHEMLCVGTDVR